MKRILQTLLFLLALSPAAQAQGAFEPMITVLGIENLTTGENNLDYRGNGVMALKLTVTGRPQTNLIIGGINPPYFPTYYNINLRVYIKKANVATPILIAQQNNVAYNPAPSSPAAFYSPRAVHIFNVTLFEIDYQAGDYMYATAGRSDGNTRPYYYPSLNKTISNCPYTPSPTNISAIPYSYGHTINFSPYGSYTMEWVDLVTNGTGTTTLYSSSTPGQGNFFYYVPQANSFKFRLKSTNSSCALWSNWYTVGPDQCPASNYPTNIVAYSQCGSQNLPSVCGGIVHWATVPNATTYQIEYVIFNTAAQTYTGTINSTGNSMTLSQYTSSSTGPWMIKLRGRSKCVNGAWSDFSDWSQNFAW